MIRRARTGILLLLALLLAACSVLPAIPAELGGLPLTHALRGEAALKEISRLHGKRILAGDGFVAHYEGNRTVAMLYVSGAHAGPVAGWQLSRMVTGIEKAAANTEGQFFHLKAEQRDGLTLYSALGLGQIHYFYRSGATIVWLAADPPVARRALADTLRLLR